MADVGTQPNIRYARTHDGVNIAYWRLGDGPPLVYLSPAGSHLAMEWRIPKFRGPAQRLAENHTLLRFDTRGLGLSDRDLELTLDGCVADIDAVLAAEGIERCAILAIGTMGPAGVAFAGQRQEVVTHLILSEAPIAYADLGEGARSLRNLLLADYDLYIKTVATVQYGWDGNEDTQATEAMMRAMATHQEMIRYEAALRELDASSYTAQVTCPTLVLHHMEMAVVPQAAVRRITAAIPHAQLALLEGTLPSERFADQGVDAFESFIFGQAPAQRDRRGRDVVTVLFTDLVGHTEMMQRLGDAKGRELLREHERITRETLKQHGGAEVKSMGDGFMASFGSVTSAVECAVTLQRAFAAHSTSAPEPLSVRVGLNAGEPIEEDGDLFGSTVILAARIASQAGAGEILVPESVRGLLSGKNFLFADRGEVVLKGFEDAQRLFEVRWRA